MHTRGDRRGVLVGLSVAVIAVATGIPSGADGSRSCALCGHRAVADLLLNLLLFMPLGYALARRGNSFTRVVLTGVLTSLSIELAQLAFIRGRDASIGDVLANGCGAAMGWAVYGKRLWLLPGADGRPLRAPLFSACASCVLLAGLALFTPSVSGPGHLFLRWAPRDPDLDVYPGRVWTTRVGLLALDTAGPIENPDLVSEVLAATPLEVVADLGVPGEIAPIISIHDERGREMFLLGAARADLVIRYRLLADELRLDRGDLRVHQALERVPPGAAYRLRLTLDRRGYCLQLDRHEQCARGFTVGDTWSLLLALDWGADVRVALRALWMVLLFIPAGVGVINRRGLAAAGSITTVLLVAGPIALGFAATPPYQLIASWIGLLLGRVLAGRVSGGAGRKVQADAVRSRNAASPVR